MVWGGAVGENTRQNILTYALVSSFTESVKLQV